MMSGETSESRAAHGPAVLVSLVLNALQNAKQGNTKDYDMLIQKLADPDIKVYFVQ